MDRRRFGEPATHDGFAREDAPSARVAAGRGSPVLEGHRYMLHVTCDHCGKELRAGEDHFVAGGLAFEEHASFDPPQERMKPEGGDDDACE